MYQIQSYILIVIAGATFISAQQIESKIACEWKPLTLDCKTGHLLTIISANYGRTSSAVCSHQEKTDCRSTTSLEIMKNMCDGKPSCTVMARNDVFGDSCYGVIKYLEVHFKCAPAPPCSGSHFKCDDGRCIRKKSICDGKNDCSGGEDETGCKYKTAYGCEHGTLNVECKRGELIRVLHGNYGRTNSAICQTDNSNVNCLSPVADGIIKERCDLQRSCSVPATNGVFGDPCGGTLKYAEMKYTCWPIPL